jgi:hypothetical protein
VYGKAPPLSTAVKQGSWIETQKAKMLLPREQKPVVTGLFSEFY